MGLLLVVLLSAAALVVDMGDLYYSYQELQGATTAAAMAGGSAIPQGTGVNTAYTYSGDKNSPANATYNIHANLNITAVTPTLGCISTTTYATLGLPPCIVYGSQPSANAIQVVETAKVPMYFAKIFGVSSLNISATAIASAKGGGSQPYNIMMVLDTTTSMGQGSDTGCGGKVTNPTPEQCAQEGIQILLGELDPCSVALSNCGGATNGNVSKPVDEVGLMVFPGLCSSTATGVTTSNCPTVRSGTTATATTANSTYAQNDYTCSSNPPNPPITPYNNNPEYLILPLQSDYRASDSTTTLNGGSGNSNLVNSVGAGASPCPGADDPGGEGTFYAGAIYAAQSYLLANTRTGVKNVIILLSDGDANASSTQMGGSVAAPSVYSSSNQCAQAVSAASAARIAGILFYSVSYGSETSGCSTDSPTTTPCATMASMASTPTSQFFFSVPQSGSGSGTVCSGARTDIQLSQVFSDIAGDLTTSRRIPNGSYGGIF
jgi:hypothetical protein